jgi:eukaryotic translation initiation factor 2C
VIVTAHDGEFPPECCTLLPWQKYNFKLSPEQTAKMIKFAVTRPPIRVKQIMANVDKLNWSQDPYLREFDIRVNPTMPTVRARLLQNPEIQYANGKLNPGVSGRWIIQNKKFSTPAMASLKSWGVVVSSGCIDKPALTNFMDVSRSTV